MKKVIVRAPVRADLAGGTLDLWPLYLFHTGSRTVNVAISYHAESEVIETGDDAIDLHLDVNLIGQQYEQRYQSIHELAADPLARALEIAAEFEAKGAEGVAYAKRLTRAALDRPIRDALADERQAFFELIRMVSAREGLRRGRQPASIQEL